MPWRANALPLPSRTSTVSSCQIARQPSGDRAGHDRVEGRRGRARAPVAVAVAAHGAAIWNGKSSVRRGPAAVRQPHGHRSLDLTGVVGEAGALAHVRDRQRHRHVGLVRGRVRVPRPGCEPQETRPTLPALPFASGVPTVRSWEDCCGWRTSRIPAAGRACGSATCRAHRRGRARLATGSRPSAARIRAGRGRRTCPPRSRCHPCRAARTS